MNTVEAAQEASKKLHKEYIGKRYIEVFQVGGGGRWGKWGVVGVIWNGWWWVWLGQQALLRGMGL